jgi:hypothetical protein
LRPGFFLKEPRSELPVRTGNRSGRLCRSGIDKMTRRSGPTPLTQVRLAATSTTTANLSEVSEQPECAAVIRGLADDVSTWQASGAGDGNRTHVSCLGSAAERQLLGLSQRSAPVRLFSSRCVRKPAIPPTPQEAVCDRGSGRQEKPRDWPGREGSAVSFTPDSAGPRKHVSGDDTHHECRRNRCQPQGLVEACLRRRRLSHVGRKRAQVISSIKDFIPTTGADDMPDRALLADSARPYTWCSAWNLPNPVTTG